VKRLAVLAALLAFAAGALAQPYPARPITLVVPYTPGTGIDIIARTVGPKLTERWGQPVVVENKPGASGNIGAGVVAKAPADGYTMMVTVNTFTITPALYASLPYDPVKDFTVVGGAATGNLALVANAAAGIKDLKELVAASKARQLNYSSPGNGTPQHLAMEVLKQRLHFEALHVPYKGAAQALTDLLGGQVQLAVLPVHTALPHAKAGRIHVIAVSGERRSVLAPDLPSFADLGLKNLGLDLYFWLAGPAGLPQDVAQKWTHELASILALPDVRETFLRQGMVPNAAPPDQQAGEIAADVVRWRKFISDNNSGAVPLAEVLLRGRRERRQLRDIARVVLDDDGRLQVLGDALDPLERGDRLGAVVVEAGHAVALVVLVEVRRIAEQYDRPLLLQPHEQRLVTRRMARRAQHHHRAVAEHVLVGGLRLDLAGAAEPVLEARDVRARHGLGRGERLPFLLADEQRRVRHRVQLAGVVGVEMADADILHLLGLDLELRELLAERDLRRIRIGAGQVARVPDHVVVAVLDHVAAESERHLRLGVGVRVAEAPLVVEAVAAVEARERDFRRLGKGPGARHGGAERRAQQA
jgi:tripartite-type tricarboxylate transporter receptor subunit TctC